MATLVRWDPIREVTAVQNELSRFMNGLFEGNGRTTQTWVPTLDAWETEDALVYAFDLPGVSQDSISVEAEDNLLTVIGRAGAELRDLRRSLPPPGAAPRHVLAHRRAAAGRLRGRDHGLLQGRRAGDPRPEARAGRSRKKIEVGFAGPAPAGTIDGTAETK